MAVETFPYHTFILHRSRGKFPVTVCIEEVWGVKRSRFASVGDEGFPFQACTQGIS